MTTNFSYLIPGFGCSYPRECHELHQDPPFALRFAKKDERFSWQQTRPAALFLLEAGKCRVVARKTSSNAKSTEYRASITHKQWVMLPANTLCEIEPETLLLKFAIVGFTPDDVSRCSGDYHVQEAELAALLEQAHLLPVTVWILELFHRVIFERIVTKTGHSFASMFCRRELIKEAFYKNREVQNPNASSLPRHHELSPALQNILLYIENNLHAHLSLAIICKKSAMSESAMLRMFRAEMSTTPMKHIWTRRLQDARLMLRTGRFRVSEVAALVGYAEISSFSQAFKREFGEAPATEKMHPC